MQKKKERANRTIVELVPSLRPSKSTSQRQKYTKTFASRVTVATTRYPKLRLILAARPRTHHRTITSMRPMLAKRRRRRARFSVGQAQHGWDVRGPAKSTTLGNHNEPVSLQQFLWFSRGTGKQPTRSSYRGKESAASTCYCCGTALWGVGFHPLPLAVVDLCTGSANGGQPNSPTRRLIHKKLSYTFVTKRLAFGDDNTPRGEILSRSRLKNALAIAVKDKHAPPCFNFETLSFPPTPTRDVPRKMMSNKRIISPRHASPFRLLRT